jgi:hypothetical protein
MKKRMVFVILVCLGCMPLFGQQELWTTVELWAVNGTRVISMNHVKAEILKFADQYDFYLDMSGYSFDNYPSGQGPLLYLELQLNGNKGLVSAIKAPIYGQQMVTCTFTHRQGIDMLAFHDGVITGSISTSNRRSLESLIDQLIANCR